LRIELILFGGSDHFDSIAGDLVRAHHISHIAWVGVIVALEIYGLVGVILKEVDLDILAGGVDKGVGTDGTAFDSGFSEIEVHADSLAEFVALDEFSVAGMVLGLARGREGSSQQQQQEADDFRVGGV
jgi:hypothetical protein